MKNGIDVSVYQGDIDWKNVKNSGIEFAIIKAGGSDAGFYTDSKFEQNYRNAKAVGILLRQPERKSLLLKRNRQNPQQKLSH